MLNYIPKKKLILLIGDILLILFAYFLSPVVRFRIFLIVPIEFWKEAFIILTIFLFFFYIGDFYNTDSGFIKAKFIFKYLVIICIASIVTVVVFFLLKTVKLDRGIFIINVCLIGIFIFFWRYFFEKFLKIITPAKKKTFLIIGAGKDGNKIYNLLKRDAANKIVGFIDSDHAKTRYKKPLNSLYEFNEIENIVRRENIDHIILAVKNLNDDFIIKKILKCKLDGVKVYDIPSFYEEMMGKIEVEHLSDLWILNMPIHGVKRNIYNLKIKRIISIFLSILLLVITSPVFLLAMIAVKLDSKGPVFFKQKRVGLNGEVFELIKFRTMYVGTENDRTHAGKKDDPRITRIGKILRGTRIDELPQLFNVLKGEMSLIGPRALMIEEVEEFEKKIPYFSIRHCVKPGVTGWAQVNYPHGVTVKDALEKLKYDLFYIKNLSPFLDFHIIMRTIRVVLFRKGAK